VPYTGGPSYAAGPIVGWCLEQTRTHPDGPASSSPSPPAWAATAPARFASAGSIGPLHKDAATTPTRWCRGPFGERVVHAEARPTGPLRHGHDDHRHDTTPTRGRSSTSATPGLPAARGRPGAHPGPQPSSTGSLARAKIPARGRPPSPRRLLEPPWGGTPRWCTFDVQLLELPPGVAGSLCAPKADLVLAREIPRSSFTDRTPYRRPALIERRPRRRWARTT